MVLLSLLNEEIKFNQGAKVLSIHTNYLTGLIRKLPPLFNPQLRQSIRVICRNSQAKGHQEYI